MTKLNLSKDNCLSITYELSEIEAIVHGKAKDLYNAADIAGNELDPEDVLMVIRFKDGSEATFTTIDWMMSFAE